MLRRNNENALEFLLIESALERLAPGSLTLERKMALHDRIFSQLGPQDVPWKDTAREALRTRWVAVPAGLGIAAAVITALHDAGYFEQADRPGTTRQVAVSEFNVIGSVDGPIERGKLVTARTTAWITHGRSVFGLEAGTTIVFKTADGESYEIELLAGELNVASDYARVTVLVGASTGEMSPGGSAKFMRVDGVSAVHALRGAVSVAAGGARYDVRPEDGPLFVGHPGPDDGAAEDTVSGPTAVPTSVTAANSVPPPRGLAIADDAAGDLPPQASGGQSPDDVPPPHSAGGGNGNGPPAHAPGAPEDPGPGNSQGTPPEDPAGDNGNSQGNPPENPGGGNGNSQGNPPEDPGAGNGNAQGNPPEDPGAGNGNAQGNPPENSGGNKGNGNANGQDNGNGNAYGQDNGNGNAYGQDNGNGYGRSGGNGEDEEDAAPDAEEQAVQPGNNGKAVAKGHTVAKPGASNGASGNANGAGSANGQGHGETGTSNNGQDNPAKGPKG